MEYTTASGARDVGALIGALEIGMPAAIGDSALENAATYHANSTMRRLANGMCVGISDGELEATVQAGPSTHLRRNTVCLNIDDGALENTVYAGQQRPYTAVKFNNVCLPGVGDEAIEATVQAGPTTRMRNGPFCVGIDDGAIETAMTVSAGPTSAFVPACLPHVDAEIEASASRFAGPTHDNLNGCWPSADEELEDAAAASIAVGPTTVYQGPGMPCSSPHIDDAALEDAAILHANSTMRRLPNGVCYGIDDGMLDEAVVQAGPNAQVTLLRNSRRGCEFVEVEDGALEAAVQAGPQRPTAIRLPGGGCLPGIDDGMLEASVRVTAGPTSSPGFPGCRFVDDGALEQAAAHTDVGPTVQRVATRCY